MGNLLFNLRGTVHKVVAPELEGRVLDQLYERDEETPRVRPVHNQPLQQNPERRGESFHWRRLYWLHLTEEAASSDQTVSPGDLLLDGLGVGLSKQIQHGAAEVVSVAVGVAELIGNRIQEQVTPWKDMNTWLDALLVQMLIVFRLTLNMKVTTGFPAVYINNCTSTKKSKTKHVTLNCTDVVGCWCFYSVETFPRSFWQKPVVLMLLPYPQCPGPQPGSGRCPCVQSGWWCS